MERIERLEEEQKSLADDKRDIYEEAKGSGFDVKALRAIIAMRKRDADELREHQAILETYIHALGMLVDTKDDKVTKRVLAAGDAYLESTKRLRPSQATA